VAEIEELPMVAFALLARLARYRKKEAVAALRAMGLERPPVNHKNVGSPPKPRSSWRRRSAFTNAPRAIGN
jgi:hypothetical protein